MEDKHFTSRMLIRAGALMSISGILLAICVQIAYEEIFQNVSGGAKAFFPLPGCDPV